MSSSDDGKEPGADPSVGRVDCTGRVVPRTDMSRAEMMGIQYKDRKDAWRNERKAFKRSVSPGEVHDALIANELNMTWVLRQFKAMGEGKTPSPLRMAAVRAILELMASGGQVSKLQALKAADKAPLRKKAKSGGVQQTDPLAAVDAAVAQAQEQGDDTSSN